MCTVVTGKLNVITYVKLRKAAGPVFRGGGENNIGWIINFKNCKICGEMGQNS